MVPPEIAKSLPLHKNRVSSIGPWTYRRTANLYAPRLLVCQSLAASNPAHYKSSFR
jgi:hypothetical protein